MLTVRSIVSWRGPVKESCSRHGGQKAKRVHGGAGWERNPSNHSHRDPLFHPISSPTSTPAVRPSLASPLHSPGHVPLRQGSSRYKLYQIFPKLLVEPELRCVLRNPHRRERLRLSLTQKRVVDICRGTCVHTQSSWRHSRPHPCSSLHV